jgi:hypothetical protein
MGPVEFLVLTFPGGQPGGGAVRALAGLLLSGGVRVIDTLLVARAADGTVTITDPSSIAELADLVRRGESPIAPDEPEKVGLTLDPGTCALLILVEQTWVAEAAEAVRESGGELTTRTLIHRS